MRRPKVLKKSIIEQENKNSSEKRKNMSKNIIDRRVQKTRKLLKDALISLIIEKGFEAVTIQEILDRANVGRSTFYIHFDNKQELLHNCFEEFHELFEKDNHGASSENFSRNDFILNLFRLVERNQRLCKALLGKDDMTMFFNPIHSFIYDYFEGTIKKIVINKKQDPLQLQMMTHYITSALLGTLRWWVYNDMPYTAEEMDKTFSKIAIRDVQEFFN
jgi:AcrR family transcriptional regulator